MPRTPLPRPVADCTMNELLDAHPEAVAVFVAHGVDPRTRCNVGVRGYLRLGQVLGRNCPVDDADATLQDLRRLVGEA